MRQKNGVLFPRYHYITAQTVCQHSLIEIEARKQQKAHYFMNNTQI